MHSLASTNSSPELQQFPELTKAKIDAAAQLTTRLKGDPTLVLSGDEPQNADDGETPFTELDRLAYLVDQIDRAIAVVPLGAFVVAPQRQVVLNAAFHGLKWEQATQIFNYFHLREPELPEKLKALHNADGLVRASDFLDPLVGDLDGSWDLAKDNTGSVVTLRSLAYPGAFFFHEPETARYGSVYFGDGRKNPDLAFMI
jgi:radial spoke head protein 9